MSCCDNSAIFEEWRTITNGSLAEARGAKQNQIVRRKRAERKLAGNPSGLHPGLQFENFAMAEKRKSLADLLAILQIQKKKDLKRHCRLITILQSGLAGLIYAAVADVLPWSHHAHHREFVPDHLHLTDGDLGAFAANDGERLSLLLKRRRKRSPPFSPNVVCCQGTFSSLPISPTGTFSILTSAILQTGITTGKVVRIFT